jgi:hypothetical protein
MAKNKTSNNSGWVYTPYVTRNGKRIYPKNAKVFRFPRKRY